MWLVEMWHTLRKKKLRSERVYLKAVKHFFYWFFFSLTLLLLPNLTSVMSVRPIDPWNAVLHTALEQEDKEIFDIVENEKYRQWSGLELIASEVRKGFLLKQ